MTNAKPDLIIFTGTSGSGRKTVARLSGTAFGWTHIVSCTTRPPRDREVPDRDYHYLSESAFDALSEAGQLAEQITIRGYRYGLRLADLQEALAANKMVYLILNKEGAAFMKRMYGERVVQIFLYVDKQTVRERLESKGVAYEVEQDYLAQYTDEVVYRKHCDFVIENVELNRTVEEIRRKLVSI